MDIGRKLEVTESFKHSQETLPVLNYFVSWGSLGESPGPPVLVRDHRGLKNIYLLTVHTSLLFRRLQIKLSGRNMMLCDRSMQIEDGQKRRDWRERSVPGRASWNEWPERKMIDRMDELLYTWVFLYQHAKEEETSETYYWNSSWPWWRKKTWKWKCKQRKEISQCVHGLTEPQLHNRFWEGYSLTSPSCNLL